MVDCDAPEDDDDDAVGSALVGVGLRHNYMDKDHYCRSSCGKEKDVILTKNEKQEEGEDRDTKYCIQTFAFYCILHLQTPVSCYEIK